MFWSCISVVKTIDWLWIWIFVPKNETRFIIRSLRGRDVTWQVGRSWHYWINNFRICKANDDRKKTGGKSQEKNHHFFSFWQKMWSIDRLHHECRARTGNNFGILQKKGVGLDYILIDKWHVTCDIRRRLFYQFSFPSFSDWIWFSFTMWLYV